MCEFLEITGKDRNIQKYIRQTIDRYNKESISTRSQIGQNALIRSKVFEHSIITLGDSILDMDFEIEQRDNKYKFLKTNWEYQILKMLKS